MFNKHISQLNDNQLVQRNRLCLGIAISFLIGMIVVLIISLKQMSNQSENVIFIALTPTILMPLIFIPLLYSSALSKEIKKRKSKI